MSLHVRVVRPTCTLWDRPVNILTRLLNIARFAVDAVLSIDLKRIHSLRICYNLINSSRGFVSVKIAYCQAKYTNPLASAITFTVLFESGRIRLSSLESAMTGSHPDAKVRAPASALLSMLTADAGSRRLVNPELELSGDVEWIQALLRALHRADIQWRDLLGATLGDRVSSHIISLFEASSEGAGQSYRRLRRSS